MKRFEFRGYEIHSMRMWQRGQVDSALDFMRSYHLNALIFHQNDLITQLSLPEKYFSNDIMWERWPIRRQGMLYRRDYIGAVIRKVKSMGIDFYLEVKEIDVIDDILEIVPSLRNSDGSLCPNHPFWTEYLEERIREICALFPDLAGIIVSLGTRESRLSAAASRCGCPRCRRISDTGWYVSVLRALFGPLSAAGKSLVVRDFAFTAEHQNLVVEACRQVSTDIIMALKAEPHDFYPTFPDNPQIGNTGLKEYIEFDVWGQFAGMGVAPMGLVEDIKRRMEGAFVKGARGVWFRTDWELVNDASVHCAPCMVNLYAGAMFSWDMDTETDDVYRTWIAEGLYSPLYCASRPAALERLSNTEAYRYLRDFMKASWLAFSKSGYVQGTQFLESDQPPYTIEKAFEIMTVIHARDDWDRGASEKLAVTPENMERIFAEKKQGLEETRALHRILQAEKLGAGEKFINDMRIAIDGMIRYAEFCDAAVRAMYLVSLAQKGGEPSVIRQAGATAAELYALADVIAGEQENTDYPYQFYSRLHPPRIRKFADNVRFHIRVV